MDGGNVHIFKDKGTVAGVVKTCRGFELSGTTGIGHVRWATHGVINKANAHPHTDAAGEIAVIHNGIIDNYNKLRLQLDGKYTFRSDTDTEVIPHLLRKEVDSGVSFEEAFFRVVRQLEGSYALIAVSALAPGLLFAARKDSPMVLGIGDNEVFIGSDVLSFCTSYFTGGLCGRR